MKPNDRLDDEGQVQSVRAEAQRALKNADAIGVLPTPIDQIIAAAEHEVITGHAVDAGFLRKLSRRAGGALKMALSKVRGVLDVRGRAMHLDASAPPHRFPFLKLHELAHGFLPWQRDIYAVTADCDETIAPEISDLFEREANAFASEVLFQVDAFTNEAADHPLSIKTPLRLSKRYGASVYATVRRFVRTNPRACAVLVFDPPEMTTGEGFVATLRRKEVSHLFAEQFGEIAWPLRVSPDHPLGKLIPLGSRRMSGSRAVSVADANGAQHECVAEAFTNTYQVFILICPVRRLTKSRVLVPK